MLSAADLLVASSRQETFGLCVLEALANGLRVLYTTCPALDGLDIGSARQVPIEDLGEAIAKEVAAGPIVHVPEPAVASEFGVAAVTARIDELYERLAERRSWRTAASRLRRQIRAAAHHPPPARPAQGQPERSRQGPALSQSGSARGEQT